MASLPLAYFVEGYDLGEVQYIFMSFIHQTASLVSPEKSVKSAAFISMVLVVEDIGFAGERLG